MSLPELIGLTWFEIMATVSMVCCTLGVLCVIGDYIMDGRPRND